MYSIFAAGRHPSEYSVTEVEADYTGMTSYYWTLVLGQVGAAMAATTTKQSTLGRWAPNRWLTICIVLELLLAFAVVFWSPFEGLFKTRALTVGQLSAGLGGFIALGVVEELRKLYLRRSDAGKPDETLEGEVH